MSPDRIHITGHARIRFKERWPAEPEPKCYEKELARLLELAVPEDIGHGNVTRIIDNGFEPARYYTAEGWRFVLDEQEKMLLTCERIYLRGRRKKRKIRQKKRYS